MALKSCAACGRIHQKNFNCGKKPTAKKKVTDKDKFRWTTEWKDKREEIKQRDLCLCQVCIRELYTTFDRYTYDNLSVHHAVPLEVDYERRLDNDNLITLCDRHHELAERGEIPLSVIQDIIREQESR